MKTHIRSLVLSIAAISLFTMNANAMPISDNGNTKSVGPVVWHNQADFGAQELLNRDIPANKASLFFVRQMDNDPLQTGVNIAVNDHFQVSLHPGSYTQVYSCAGINDISAQITGAKINDLLRNSQQFNLDEGSHYFFYVDVEPSTGEITLDQITQDSAIPLLQNKLYQNHQISRVIPDCDNRQLEPVVSELVIPEAPPVVTTSPITNTPPPALEEEVSIKLEILFDNDKSTIKPMYFSEINEVADFMRQYTNTTAIIEGHTDSNGRQSYNQQLSERRAMSVKSMLVNRYGINPNRVSTVGYGENRPVATNSTASGRHENRRVVAIIEER